MSVCVRMDVQARLSCTDSDGMENHVILEGKYGDRYVISRHLIT